MTEKNKTAERQACSAHSRVIFSLSIVVERIEMRDKITKILLREGLIGIKNKVAINKKADGLMALNFSKEYTTISLRPIQSLFPIFYLPRRISGFIQKTKGYVSICC